MSDVAQTIDLAGRPILVVEDEAIIRMLLVAELQLLGFKVLEAENSDAAIVELNGNTDISFVVTDVRMPGTMDGFGLALWMQENRPAIPIIITSGVPTPLDVHAINPAIVRVTAKPYTRTDVAGWADDITGFLSKGWGRA